uniref:Uncharacterized protein n=1 Tax=Lepeophtheirus salmonis TaxID=72036 RepID=A0A0K2V094_LEPSM
MISALTIIIKNNECILTQEF